MLDESSSSYFDYSESSHLPGEGSPLLAHIHYRSSSNSSSSRRRSSFTESVRQLLHYEGDRCSIRDLGGRATVTSEIFNLAKNLIGCGVLSLSNGIAMYANSPRAVWSASLWIALLGSIFGYFCLLIAKSCQMTKSATFRECWQETMGDQGALIVSVVNTLKPAMGNLAYSTILSQTFRSLLQGIGIELSRISVLLIITVFVLLPLCLLKRLDALAPLSIASTVGLIVTAMAMLIRCSDKTYQISGKYYNDIDEEYRPDFGDYNKAWCSQVLPFACIVFEAFVMHYNSPRFYAELKDASIPRFSLVVLGSFGLSAVMYMTIATAGYLTFGGNSDGLILNNYSASDPLASLCRIMIAGSTVVTFPITFIGVRDGVMDIIELPAEQQTSRNLDILTVVLLTIITCIAVVCTDLGIINAVGGGTLATMIVFVFPVMMYQKAVKHRGDMASRGQRKEVIFAMLLMVFGIILGTIGVYEALRIG